MPVEKVDNGDAVLRYKDSEKFPTGAGPEGQFVDWFVRNFFPHEIERLKGDADQIHFTEIVFDAGDAIYVEYETINEV
jgi:hypothetical protein